MEIPLITREENGHRGAFVIDSDSKRLAEMTYTAVGDKLIIIDHTDVGESLRGTGAGRKLVEAAVLWARAEGKRIVPLCPFAKSVFDKTPEYADVRQ
jgi:predicted GNAT family acetyltransferase